ncbi:hypothetical protein ACFU6S_44255 [Streptomyces sp. NPDC057456]|uniref:hypothetical protein n=1 Tax=Streptomyces sp. NPDC057456 TaxID=3346139 RepID=UPI0036C89B7A
MGSSPIALAAALTVLGVSRITARTIAKVLYERARRATLVAVLDIGRHNVVELRIHHDPNSCDLHVWRPDPQDDDLGPTGAPRRCG